MTKLIFKPLLLLPAFVIACVLLITVTGFRESLKPSGSIKPADVIIIYSGGKAFKTISEITPKEADAVSTATPSDVNIEIIAEKIGTEFRTRGYKTQLSKPEEIKDVKDIMQYKIIVLGTGVRFWNMTWEMKRMIDIHFGKIYITSKKDFAKKTVGVFAQAEITGSAIAAINALSAPASDCWSKPVATGVFLTGNNMPEDTMMVRIKKFVDEMESGFRRK